VLTCHRWQGRSTRPSRRGYEDPATDARNGDDAAAPDPGRPGREFPAALAKAFCAAATPCCAGAFDEAVCVTQAAYFLSPTDDSLPPGAPFDASAAKACLASVLALASKCSPSLAELQATLAECQPVYPGTQLPGSHCSSFTECAITPNGARTCHGVKCGVQPFLVIVGAGQACDPDRDPPLVGQPLRRCDLATPECGAESHVCEPRVPEGQACNDDSRCTAGDACGPAPTSTCVPGGKLGDPCDYHACGEGLGCDSHKKCVAVAAIGGACDVEESRRTCASNEGAQCQNGVCRSSQELRIWRAACH
jgi:hypothetical protein